MADATAPATVERFLDALGRSGLLPADAIRAALDAAPEPVRSDPRQLADYFVRLGKLSHFQARKLLENTAGGLVLANYHVVMPIGRGGMGTVYLARDTRANRLVALKILPPKKARAEERLIARFRREMDLSQRVAHPNLTQTYEVGVAQGVYFIAMEYIAGQSLYRVVTQGGPLPVGRAAKLFAQVAAGLEHAHGLGLIHRDLKPSNIMITPRDQVKVLDLGLALIEGEVVEDHKVVGGKGYVVGTFDYIAPEQTEDAAKVDARSDLYALGCTIYFALTGQPPFAGGDRRQKINKHRVAIPPPIQDLNPLVPASFAAVVHPLLSKRPEDRPRSAESLRQQLLAWAGPDAAATASTASTPTDTDAVIADLESRDSAESGWDWVPNVSLSDTARRRSLSLNGVPAWLPLALAIVLGVMAVVLMMLALWAATR
jgi:eukaryotic-like serine/threonine-protein kinase